MPPRWRAFDATSPRAMAETMRRLLVDNALSAGSREALSRAGLLGNTTGERPP
ncbi:MAG: hypothetical protein U5K76_02905 [Woeseiaceae bacterium]|nr:hypothetical protein [Woeseiaceae bacterium]